MLLSKEVMFAMIGGRGKFGIVKTGDILHLLAYVPRHVVGN